VKDLSQHILFALRTIYTGPIKLDHDFRLKVV